MEIYVSIFNITKSESKSKKRGIQNSDYFNQAGKLN